MRGVRLSGGQQVIVLGVAGKVRRGKELTQVARLVPKEQVGGGGRNAASGNDIAGKGLTRRCAVLDAVGVVAWIVDGCLAGEIARPLIDRSEAAIRGHGGVLIKRP